MLGPCNDTNSHVIAHWIQRSLSEPFEAILQLQAEGVALSKKIGELEGFLRKLRADQTAWEAERERLNARLQVMEASARSDELNRYCTLHRT